MNTIISLGISYLIMCTSIIISTLPNIIFKIKNDYINLIIIIAIFNLLSFTILNMKKIQNGFIFINKKMENENLDITLLNISMVILFTMTLLPTKNNQIGHAVFATFILIFIMIITIKKSLDAYYKQTLLIQDLKDTKEKLEEKIKEVEQLEKENIEYGKKSHTLAHKQRILESKINNMMNSEISNELNIKDEVNSLSKEIFNKKEQADLSKTGITVLDDVLRCMQLECIDKNIDFELKINGNIHFMTNHYINEEELQILIADHVKDAIIAIECSNNVNRSILVKIGQIDGTYGLYIYDSGIEFEENVLNNLGKKPITTHKDKGGTGMGFMNTFDTLKKYKASLIIKEIGKISKNEYTKVVMIKFDSNEEFKIDSYRQSKN